MANILIAEVDIEGIRPLLWHHFGPESIPLEKKEKTGVAGNDPEEWTRTVLISGPQKQLYLPGNYIFGTLVNGSRHTRMGKGSIMSLVSATLQVVDQKILINRYVPDDMYHNPRKYYNADSLPVYIDVQSVIQPTTKNRNIRYRVAASPGWQASFSIMWDKTIVNRNQMEAVIIDAGKLCGLGNGRKIGYGRFVIKSINIMEEDLYAMEKTTTGIVV